ncbi:dihydrolipoamide dehydrogenase [Oceanicola granulosus HTCC2516]|uniref:Dihydrolipoyl dehydrogenase n=1 Tax=Oceanicola granulosus (strain ATCC BAA-861 / DSM 15982 / KCTC 12143 / HTCC2516) TaxID=314256 RepID=Q2CHQ3_OCEGH|nr:dihydrolipoyl dehydrogenase [Oceanicola granulosus]EAR52241.1 dihydrolipoamide dehydrogenase [Oceanicola granulosus HTCC2516]
MIVIGAGPGGYVAAIRGAQLGMNVLCIEREHLGGICLNWGCIPTKALLRSSEVFHLMHRAKEFGLKAEGVGYDLDAVVKRSRGVAKQLSGGIGHLFKKNKVTSLMGEARIAGKGRVVVKTDQGEEEVSAPAIVVATGARARELPGLEADGDLVWTYKHALQPPRMPKKLLVIGSGAIGIEFASFYNTLGAETTVVEVMDRILPVEDAEISAFAKKQFKKQGMKILEKAMVKKLDRAKGKVTAHIESGGKVETQEFDAVISAVGIVGNTEGLGLEELGVKVDRSHVIVDEYCRTGVEGVYAIGDIAGAPWLAHKASHEGVMVAELIHGKNKVHPVRPESIAGCTYCQPQVASVGFTEAQAREKGYDIKVGKFPFIGNGKAIALGEPEGIVKTVFDAKTGELLGAHMVGAEVTELIQGYVVGRQLETTEEDLMETVFPHPTLSEMMHESVLDAYGKAIHF